MLNNIPTLTNPPRLLQKYDCVEHTLDFLGIITNSEANQLQANSCINLQTGTSQIVDLFHKRYPNHRFLERTLSFSELYQMLLPEYATFGGLLRQGQTGHAVIFVKDKYNNIYLVDRQQNIKFVNEDIYKYLNYLMVDQTKLWVISSIGLNGLKPIPGGRGKNKSRKQKSRKQKRLKHKSRKQKRLKQ
jgi:hypothetical protein